MSSTDPHVPALSIQQCWLTCGDGEKLAATWTASNKAPHAIAVINAATGVPRRYYQPFANWLAQRGYRVLSYDYRGIGGSLHGPILESRATMADWARYDMHAAIDATTRYGLPLLVIGHSAGGNLLGLVPNLPKVAAILTIGAQNAHWRYWPTPASWLLALVWHLAVPLVISRFGYLPGKLLGGSGQDLPRGVARDWARWARQRGYVFSAPEMAPYQGYADYAGPVHVWSVSDDRYAPPAAVAQLARQFSAGITRLLTITPAALGLKQIGHFGIFRPQVGVKLWPLLLQTIEAAQPSLAVATKADNMHFYHHGAR